MKTSPPSGIFSAPSTQLLHSSLQRKLSPSLGCVHQRLGEMTSPALPTEIPRTDGVLVLVESWVALTQVRVCGPASSPLLPALPPHISLSKGTKQAGGNGSRTSHPNQHSGSFTQDTPHASEKGNLLMRLLWMCDLCNLMPFVKEGGKKLLKATVARERET